MKTEQKQLYAIDCLDLPRIILIEKPYAQIFQATFNPTLDAGEPLPINFFICYMFATFRGVSYFGRMLSNEIKHSKCLKKNSKFWRNAAVFPLRS